MYAEYNPFQGAIRVRIDNSKTQFLQRSKALALYRTIWRRTGRIADLQARAESRKYARDEFERHRNVTDIVS